MMSETYLIFQTPFPCTGMSGLYYSSLLDAQAGLSVTLKESQSKLDNLIKINFRSVYSFSKTSEDFRLNTQDRIPNGQYLILIVKNSKYLKWFHEESKEIYDDDEIQHYMIVSEDYIIDVISDTSPSVTKSIEPD